MKYNKDNIYGECVRAILKKYGFVDSAEEDLILWEKVEEYANVALKELSRKRSFGAKSEVAVLLMFFYPEDKAKIDIKVETDIAEIIAWLQLARKGITFSKTEVKE